MYIKFLLYFPLSAPTPVQCRVDTAFRSLDPSVPIVAHHAVYNLFLFSAKLHEDRVNSGDLLISGPMLGAIL